MNQHVVSVRSSVSKSAPDLPLSLPSTPAPLHLFGNTLLERLAAILPGERQTQQLVLFRHLCAHGGFGRSTYDEWIIFGTCASSTTSS